MGLLDQLAGLRARFETSEEAARARERRNISVGLLQERARERRIDRATPRDRQEALASARRQLEEARAARARARTARRAAKERTPRDERSTLRRLASAAGGAAKRAVSEFELEAREADARGDSTKAMAARAEDAATMGAPIPGATLDPAPGPTLEEMATAGVEWDDESHGDEGGLWWENFVTGSGDPRDRDEDGRPERDPLDFDDPLGLTGGRG